MKTYKWYVTNHTYPEGCIAERYLMDEAMRYCMEYIPSSKRGSLKCAMANEIDGGYHVDKGKDYLLSTLQYQQARKWLLRKSDENVKWEK